MCPSVRAICLLEAAEDTRQELGLDPDPGVTHFDLGWPSADSSRTLMRPPMGVNLIAFTARFQTICCRRMESP